MDVSIIIVNYNTKALTKQCLESVYEKTKDVEFEVIVVDNNSTDGSIEMLENEFPNVKLIKNKINLGFGQANNIGVKIANGRHLLFLNPDTVLINNAVIILTDYLDKNQDTGVCGGNLYSNDNRPAYSFSRLLPPILEIDMLSLSLLTKIIYGKNQFFNHTHKPLSVAYITGADLMIPKNLFNSMNGFDPDFFMYAEETELQWRIAKAGYKRICIPGACIIHLDGKSWTSDAERARAMWKSIKVYLAKTQNRLSILLSYCCFYILISLRLMFFFITNNKKKLNYWSAIFKELFSSIP